MLTLLHRPATDTSLVTVSGGNKQRRRLRIGDAELGYAELAIRCVVITVDQRTDTKAGPEPIRTLATNRRAPPGGVAFGVKLYVASPSKLAVGDTVNVDF
jgi:uncharacterized protein YcbX